MTDTDTITITRKEYDQLVKDSVFLSRLEAAGVDNWDGYSMAFDDEEDDGEEPVQHYKEEPKKTCRK